MVLTLILINIFLAIKENYLSYTCPPVLTSERNSHEEEESENF